MLAPSPRFVKGLQANLQYWHGRTAALQDDAAIARLHPDFANLLRVVEMGLVLPQTQLATAELIGHSFYWVEKTGHVLPWLPLLERTLQCLPTSAHLLRVKLLRQLGQFQRKQYQWFAAVDTLQMALSLATALNDAQITADIHLSLAQAYRMGHQYPLAHTHASQALAHVHHLSPTHILIIELLGMLAHSAGQYDEAVHYYQQAIALQHQTHHTTYLHRTLQELALTLQTQKKWTAAHAIYTQLINLLRPTPNSIDLAHALNSQGTAYYGQGELTSAQACFEEAELVIRPLSQHFYLKGALFNNMACIWRDQEQWALAQQAYQRSLAAYEQIGDDLLIAKAEGNMGKLFLRQHQPITARPYLSSAVHRLTKLSHNAQAQTLYEEYQTLLTEIEG